MKDFPVIRSSLCHSEPPPVILNEVKDLALLPFTQGIRTRSFVTSLLRMTVSWPVSSNN